MSTSLDHIPIGPFNGGMKVKQHPDDFRVEEQTAVVPGTTGSYAFYQLDKTSWTTPDALSALRRFWKLAPHRVSYGGLKDKHAHTTQFLTIWQGPKQDWSHQTLRVSYRGQLEEPFTAKDIVANRFTIRIRHLTGAGERLAIESARELETIGVPNYFDDQRFGSVPPDGSFVARELVHGRFEDALKVALTAPYAHDRAPQKTEKRILIEHWGQWTACQAALGRGHARSLVDYLRTHPTDFRGAIARLRPELGGLYLAAYQSHLWNQMVDWWIRDKTAPQDRGEVPLQLGNWAVPLRIDQALEEKWSSLTFPLLSARITRDPAAEWTAAADAVLAQEELELTRLKIPGLSKPFFSRGDRQICLKPQDLSLESEPDTLQPGRRAVVLGFTLPRGCYATMIVKRLTSIRRPGS